MALSVQQRHDWDDARRFVACIAVVVGAGTVLAGAYGFQYIGGYIPCELCLQQRIPYFVGIPLAAFGVLINFRTGTGPDLLTKAVLYLLACVFAVSALFGLYHAGVEWGFWPGPATCAAGAQEASITTDGLLTALETTTPPSCSDATFRALRLSFAGWNAVASAAFVAISLWGARADVRRA